MPVNWGIGAGNNALANFGYGVQLGQGIADRREAREQRNALLQMREQEMAARQQQQEQQARQQQQQQRRADLPMLGKLLDYAQDEPTYQQARQVAQQYGIDTSGLPETFDPNWIGQQRQVVQMLQTPQGQEALSNAGKQAMDAGFQPGTPEYTAVVRQIITASMAQPYMGSQGETRLYTPDVFGGGGQVQGGVPFDPNEWEVIEQGGPGGSPSGAGFRP